MRALAQQPLARLKRLMHQPGVARRQVAQPAVNQLGRGGGGARREIALFEHQRAVAARGDGRGDRRAVNPAADDDHVVFGRHGSAASDPA